MVRDTVMAIKMLIILLSLKKWSIQTVQAWLLMKHHRNVGTEVSLIG